MVDHVKPEPKFELIGSDRPFCGLRHLRYGTGHDDPTPFTLTLTPQYVAREVKKAPPVLAPGSYFGRSVGVTGFLRGERSNALPCARNHDHHGNHNDLANRPRRHG